MMKTPNILETNAYLQEFVSNFMSKCKEVDPTWSPHFTHSFIRFSDRGHLQRLRERNVNSVEFS